MPRRVLIQRGQESFDLVEVPAPNEHHLQEVMKMRPQLIPSDDLGLDGDLLVVGRETTLASGAIDLLCLARSGDLVLIEFKTGPQNPDFRAALAQLIDYGSDLWRMNVEDFDRGVVQRYLASHRAEASFAGAQDLNQAVERTNWQLTDEERGEFDRRIADALASGDFIYVVAAQRFTEPMKASLEYLNATMRFGRFYLVEIVQLGGNDITAHAAQVVAAPSKRSSAAVAGGADQTNEATFLAGISNEAQRLALGDLFATCASLGVEVKWRSKGVALRILTPDRRQPLSVGWGFQPGDSWQGAKDLTLGVDEGSLSQTPTVDAAVRRYIDQIAAIPGAVKVNGASLNAFTFSPDAIPGAIPAARDALEQLARTAQAVG
jgi:hypothetical protein